MDKKGWLLIHCLVLPFKIFAYPTALCGGANALLSITDRPTIAESTCAVPNNHAVLELGLQAEKLVFSGQAQQFPTPQFRIGLPLDNEVYAILPNYNHQTVAPTSGWGPTSIGYKQMIGYTDTWLFTLDGVITPPSGSVNFGNQGFAAIVNGILTYKLNSKLTATFQLGFSTETESESSGGRRFNSINPDLILTLALSDKLQFYGEIYGQSKTSADEAMGFNAASGFIYLLAKNITIDIEAGQRIDGFLGNIEHYVGAGTAILF
ncbi:MAG: transporter [Tatlockia sp.]|nr:transporter [Tatlockia sp.]